MSLFCLKIGEFQYDIRRRCEVHFYFIPLDSFWPVGVYIEEKGDNILELRLPLLFTLEFALFLITDPQILDDL